MEVFFLSFHIKNKNKIVYFRPKSDKTNNKVSI